MLVTFAPAEDRTRDPRMLIQNSTTSQTAGFICWISVAPAFQCVSLAVEYSSCSILALNLEFYVCCFDA